MERRSVFYAVQQWRRERTLSNEAGHVPPPLEEYPEMPPGAEPIVIWQDEDFAEHECLDITTVLEGTP